LLGAGVKNKHGCFFLCGLFFFSSLSLVVVVVRKARIRKIGESASHFQNEKTPAMGTFVVRGYDARTSREEHLEKMKTVAEDNTRNFRLIEGKQNGTIFLNHCLDKGWGILKTHPDGLDGIKFPGQNEELVSAKEMLTSAFLSAENYMESLQGLYICHCKRDDVENVEDVQCLLVVPSLCLSPERFETRDYQSLLAMINIVRNLRGEGSYAFNRNPLKAARDACYLLERMDGLIVR